MAFSVPTFGRKVNLVLVSSLALASFLTLYLLLRVARSFPAEPVRFVFYLPDALVL